MKILLDTHTFLWFINDSPELSGSAADLLESDVDLLLSTASLWEDEASGAATGGRSISRIFIAFTTLPNAKRTPRTTVIPGWVP